MKTAVLGATGLVGRTLLKLLEDCDWLEGRPLPLASARSSGTQLPFRRETLTVREVGTVPWEGLDLVLASAGGRVSRQWGPQAAAAGAWVIDNTSAFRMDSDVPLIVPEINGHLAGAAANSAGGGIIANPNCSTIQIAMAAAPLGDRLRGVHVTTFQAVSGAGQAAVDELRNQDPHSGDPSRAGSIFPRAIAGNVIPAIGVPLEDGSYEEETKVVRELRKILGRGRDLAVSCTAVRVPVEIGHGAAVRLVCDGPLDRDEVLSRYAGAPGIVLRTDAHDFVTPREIAGDVSVHVGRLRIDPEQPQALMAWVVADNLLKGAAWNAVQIAEHLARGRAR